MDPITTAIVAALAKLSGTVVVDAYKGLKQLLEKKFGKESDLVGAVDKLEEKPDSKARQAVVQEEVEAAGAHEDEDLQRAAEALLERIKAQPGGQQVIQTVTQTVTGDRNIFSGTGSVSVGGPAREE